MRGKHEGALNSPSHDNSAVVTVQTSRYFHNQIMIATETPKKFRREKQTAYIHSLKRHANGDWTAHIVICARAILPDGRAVYGSHIIPLRCRQLGRKKK